MPDSHNALCEFRSTGGLALDGFPAEGGGISRRIEKESSGAG
jgi:hypothetical protein